MSKRLQDLPLQTQTALSDWILIKRADNIDYRISFQNFINTLLQTGDIGTNIGQIPALIAGTGSTPALPPVSGENLTNLQSNIPTGNLSTLGLLRLSDNINDVSNVNAGFAATPNAVKQAFDNANASVKKAGDTMTGNLVHTNNRGLVGSSVGAKVTPAGTEIQLIKLDNDDDILIGQTNARVGVFSDDPRQFWMVSEIGNPARQYRIFNEGFMGTGSGLDADLLDGLHSTSFGQRGAANTWTSTNTFENSLVAEGQVALRSTSPNLVIQDSDSTGASQVGFMNLQDNTGTQKARIGFDSSSNNFLNLYNSYNPNNGVTINNFKIWHAGNDGSGSGLNADLLDGLHSSDFLRSNVGYVGIDNAGSSTYPRFMLRNNTTSSNDWLRATSVGGGFLPYSNGSSYLGTNSWRWSQVHANTFYESGSPLSSKYLGVSANAVSATNANNANSLGGQAASNYVRRNVNTTMLGDLIFSGIRGIYFNARSGTSYGYVRQPSTGNIDIGADAAIRFIETDANVVIGSINTNNRSLTMSGNITAFSDKRVKKDIKKIDNSLSKVSKLNGYTFERTDMNTSRQTGVIAQEVLEVLPEAVNEDEEGNLSVAYGNMIGLLIEAIKDLKEEIEELKGESR